MEKGTPGFEVTKYEHKLGIRGSSTGELVFEDCKIPASNLLGEEGQGFYIAMYCYDGGRVGIAAQAVGIAQAAFEEAVEFAKQEYSLDNLLQTSRPFSSSLPIWLH